MNGMLGSLGSRVIHEDWTIVFPIIAFLISFPIFVYIVYRAVRMKKSKAEHAAHLPLQKDEEPVTPRKKAHCDGTGEK